MPVLYRCKKNSPVYNQFNTAYAGLKNGEKNITRRNQMFTISKARDLTLILENKFNI